MTRRRLDSITIDGLTSMASVTVSLGDVNILVGANGAGKSNFVAGLEMLGRLLEHELGLYVGTVGGASALLHGGPKRTRQVRLRLQSGDEWYEAELIRASGDVFVFGAEQLCIADDPSTGAGQTEVIDFGSGGREASVAGAFADDDNPIVYEEDPAWVPDPTIYDASAMLNLLYGVRVFHFHDTSRSAPVKQFGPAADNEELHADAGNLAAFLKRIKDGNVNAYRRIVKQVQQVAPFLRDFVLRPENNDQIRLRWRQEGTDQILPADALSDGTLRFICLTTLLNQPDPPGLLVIDEPELGLHPFAIVQLADMLRSTGTRGQVLVATQSVTLVNQFSLDDLIVAQRKNGASEFTRPNAGALSAWLDDYALGELWEKNLLGGRPVKEDRLSMARVHLLVEGQTEEIVVRDVLEPYLRDQGLYISSSILVTKRPASGAASHGGVSKWFKLKSEIQHLLKDTSLDTLTTIVDYYGLPPDTPGMATRPVGDPYDRVDHVEAAMRDAIGDNRFLPHAVLHELESWVLCGSEALGTICEDRKAARQLRRLVDDAGGPERVNDGPNTAPSKQILRHLPTYRKTFDGPWTISEIGVPAIRAVCPHADRWFEALLRP